LTKIVGSRGHVRSFQQATGHPRSDIGTEGRAVWRDQRAPFHAHLLETRVTALDLERIAPANIGLA